MHKKSIVGVFYLFFCSTFYISSEVLIFSNLNARFGNGSIGIYFMFQGLAAMLLAPFFMSAQMNAKALRKILLVSSGLTAVLVAVLNQADFRDVANIVVLGLASIMIKGMFVPAFWNIYGCDLTPFQFSRFVQTSQAGIQFAGIAGGGAITFLIGSFSIDALYLLTCLTISAVFCFVAVFLKVGDGSNVGVTRDGFQLKTLLGGGPGGQAQLIRTLMLISILTSAVSAVLTYQFNDYLKGVAEDKNQFAMMFSLFFSAKDALIIAVNFFLADKLITRFGYLFMIRLQAIFLLAGELVLVFFPNAWLAFSFRLVFLMMFYIFYLPGVSVILNILPDGIRPGMRSSVSMGMMFAILASGTVIFITNALSGSEAVGIGLGLFCAACALGCIWVTRRAIDLYIDMALHLLESQESSLKEKLAAIEALRERKIPRAVDVLSKISSSPVTAMVIRQKAIELLARMGNRQNLTLLTSMLKSGEIQSQIFAARTLTDHYIRHLKSDSLARHYCLGIIRQVVTSSTRPTDEDTELNVSSTKLMIQLEYDHSFPVLLEQMLSSTDHRLISNVIEAVGGLRSGYLFLFLHRFLDSENVRVRTTAATVLYQRSHNVDEIEKAVLPLLSGSKGDKMSALWAIGKMKSEHFVGRLMTHVRRNWHDFADLDLKLRMVLAALTVDRKTLVKRIQVPREDLNAYYGLICDKMRAEGTSFINFNFARLLSDIHKSHFLTLAPMLHSLPEEILEQLSVASQNLPSEKIARLRRRVLNRDFKRASGD